jgi:hypothetical protein
MYVIVLMLHISVYDYSNNIINIFLKFQHSSARVTILCTNFTEAKRLFVCEGTTGRRSEGSGDINSGISKFE